MYCSDIVYITQCITAIYNCPCCVHNLNFEQSLNKTLLEKCFGKVLLEKNWCYQEQVICYQKSKWDFLNEIRGRGCLSANIGYMYYLNEINNVFEWRSLPWRSLWWNFKTYILIFAQITSLSYLFKTTNEFALVTPSFIYEYKHYVFNKTF